MKARTPRPLSPDPVPNSLRSNLAPYNTTPFERLAIVPGSGVRRRPPFLSLGDQVRVSEAFADLGVRHPLGFENLHSIEDVIAPDTSAGSVA